MYGSNIINILKQMTHNTRQALLQKMKKREIGTDPSLSVPTIVDTDIHLIAYSEIDGTHFLMIDTFSPFFLTPLSQ